MKSRLLKPSRKRRLNNPKVRRFLENHLPIIKDAYSPDQVWLFGSYAHGRPNRWSDLDLMIISKKFTRGSKLHRRSTFLRKTGLRSNGKIIVDPLCYTPAEFERWKDAPTIIQEVVKTGIRVI